MPRQKKHIGELVLGFKLGHLLLKQQCHTHRIHGFLGQVVDLALYETKVLGSKPQLGGLSTNP